MLKEFANKLAILTSAILTGCCPSSDLSEADLNDEQLMARVDNSVNLNGLTVNGLTVNGFTVNGLTVNGLTVNGASLYGVTYRSGTLKGQPLSDLRLDSGLLSGRAGGQRLRGAELTGAVLTGVVSVGPYRTEAPFRIDGVSVTADGLTRYSVAANNGTQWAPMCGTLSDGSPIRVVALPGRWDMQTGEYSSDDSYFTFACENAAIGKCAVWGYRPWATATECDSNRRCREQPLAAWHQACTRMVRADYCGDGVPHTRNGTPINIWDPMGIQNRELGTGWPLEAEWTQQGAVCIRHTRWERAGSGAETDLQYIQRVCPDRLASNNKTKSCSETKSDFVTKNGLREDLDERPLLRNESNEGY